MVLFVKIVNVFQLLTIYAKSTILDVQLGTEYAFHLFRLYGHLSERVRNQSFTESKVNEK